MNEYIAQAFIKIFALEVHFIYFLLHTVQKYVIFSNECEYIYFLHRTDD